MAAGFHDAAVRHDVDPVGAHGRRETVRDHDGDPAPRCGVKSLEPVAFTPGIHGASRFVQKDDGRAPEEGAGKRDSLPFASAQLRAVVKPPAERVLVPAGQARDNLIGGGRSGRRFDLSHRSGRSRIAQADVFRDRRVIADGRLEHDGDHAPELLNRQVAQIHTVNLDAAAVGVIQAAEELDQRALACAVRADQGNDLSSRYRESKIVKSHPIASRIAERDPIKMDSLSYGNGRRKHMRRIYNARLQRQKLKQVAEE